MDSLFAGLIFDDLETVLERILKCQHCVTNGLVNSARVAKILICPLQLKE